MMKAAWLGSWKAPWGLGRGRRWGDRPWALAALGQAWLLGGREGRWPRVAWEARLPFGPRPAEPVRRWGPRPEGPWVALLRHGRQDANPLAPDPEDTPHLQRAWEALLDGEALPLLALGTALLDRRSRATWVPVLGAVDPSGHLHLPPFLEPLVPVHLRALPPGWWETLLGRLDPEGRLLPEGPPPRAVGQVPREVLEPLVLAHRPPFLDEYPDLRREVAPGQWMVAPLLRAWGRGWGPTPDQLSEGRSPNADLGDLDALRPLLQSLPSHLAQRELPPWADDPDLSADPFRWWSRAQADLERGAVAVAQQGYGRAHLHFLELKAKGWAERCAHSAASCAARQGDRATQDLWLQWAGSRTPAPLTFELGRSLTHPQGAQGAQAEARALLRKHPEHMEAWAFLLNQGLATDDAALVQEALPHLPDPAHLALGTTYLAEAWLPGPPEPATPETRAQWARLAHRRGHLAAEAAYAFVEVCPDRLLRLELGMDLLAAAPDLRTPPRLLDLQATAHRAGAEAAFRQLASYWPRVAAWPEAPGTLHERALALLRSAGLPLWVLWGETRPQVLGAGEPPPEGLIEVVFQDQDLPPMAVGGKVWLTHRLTWEGAPVGFVLVGLDPAGDLHLPPWIPLLAPWVARLTARPAESSLPVEAGGLLTDGSEPMGALLRDLQQVAPSRLPVVILGPSGTGKELAAREVHLRSGRPGKWVPVNCAAFAEGLLESELFGHVKGAFTGASRDRAGALEMASGGTLFLDEVADLSPKLQSLLLRALQEGEVQRVGSDRVVRVDLRIVAATHKDLEAMVAAGTFRADLWFRLQGSVLRMPSLAERRHELPWLLPRLAAQVAREGGVPAPILGPGLARALARLPWPGNVRELKFSLHRALLRAGGEPLAPRHFPELAAPEPQATSWEEATRTFQRDLLLKTLRVHRHRIAETARALGISRPALYATAKRLDIDVRALREA
jgi:transcriptional regulator with AAA-type ATPase domain